MRAGFFALVALVVGLAVDACPATIIDNTQQEFMCPLCKKTCTDIKVTWSRPPEDPPLITCPRCLYSAIVNDFERPPEEDLPRLRTAIADLPAALGRLAPEDLGVPLASIEEDRIMACWLIAWHCYQHRTIGSFPPASLLLRALSDVSRKEVSPLDQSDDIATRRARGRLAPRLRAIAVDSIGAELAGNAISERWHTTLLLALARIKRDEGRVDEAIAGYEALDQFVQAWREPPSTQMYSQRGYEELARWGVFECRLPQMTVPQIEAALEVDRAHQKFMTTASIGILRELARREDEESFAALRKYLKSSAGNLGTLLDYRLMDAGRLASDAELHQFYSDLYDKSVRALTDETIRAELGKDDRSLRSLLDWLVGEGRAARQMTPGCSHPITREFFMWLVKSREKSMLAEFASPAQTSLDDFARNRISTTARVVELNPGLKPEAPIQAGQVLQLLRAEQPNGITCESMIILCALPELLVERNDLAAEYLGRWIATAGPAAMQIEGLTNCIRAVSMSPEMITLIMAAAPADPSPDQRLLLDALAYAAGRDEPRQQLLKELEQRHEWDGQAILIVTALDRRRDPAARSWVCSMINERTSRRAVLTAADYLSRAGTIEDVAAIERALTHWWKEWTDPFERQHLESAMRAINLRAKLRR